MNFMTCNIHVSHINACMHHAELHIWLVIHMLKHMERKKNRMFNIRETDVFLNVCETYGVFSFIRVNTFYT